MHRYIILCLFLSFQSCNLNDDFSKNDVGGDVGEDVSKEASEGCKTYCAKVDNTCLGANILYQSMESCFKACALFTDRPNAKGAFTGDTLQCRIYHIEAASSNPSIHCPHGSAKTQPGKCRDFQTLCSTYCGELSEICAADFEKEFASENISTLQNCLNRCPGIISEDGESISDDTTDTVSCRLKQLAQQNCDGGQVESTVCVDPFN